MNPTTFEEIYARCRGRIRDYDKSGLSDELFKQSERDLLELAIDDFSKDCAQDISSYDDVLECFNVELSRSEKSILSYAMIVHWLEPYIYNSDALKNAMSTKDFTFFSPANLLEKMHNLYDFSIKKLHSEINSYSFRMNNVSELNK